MEISLQLAALGILGSYQATAGRSKLVKLFLQHRHVSGQFGVEHRVVGYHARVGRQILDQGSLNRAESAAGWQLGGDVSERLSLEDDRYVEARDRIGHRLQPGERWA